MQAEAMISSVHYEFDKTNGLKMGTVTFHRNYKLKELTI